ncbi:MAG: protein-L-isoaspartate(D-aspartate) O-methyltransferase [bacterium]
MKDRPKKPDRYAPEREQMVTEQLVRRDIIDLRVLNAMRRVPRHLFVPEKHLGDAYRDSPLSIGMGQTISQPYVVASMTQQLQLKPDHKVLEVGTGCGYQAAVLAELVRQVFTVELIPELHERARRNLKKAGYQRVQSRVADGASGWPEKGPFDAIIVTAAAPRLPSELIGQLKTGGRLVIPLAAEQWGRQYLHKITRTAQGLSNRRLYEVRFVPMVGEIER